MFMNGGLTFFYLFYFLFVKANCSSDVYTYFKKIIHYWKNCSLPDLSNLERLRISVDFLLNLGLVIDGLIIKKMSHVFSRIVNN